MLGWQLLLYHQTGLGWFRTRQRRPGTLAEAETRRRQPGQVRDKIRASGGTPVVQFPPHILTDEERRLDAYQHLRGVAKENPDLATWVACEQISERRKYLISTSGYGISQGNHVRFLKRLCSKPEAEDDWDETRCPKALESIWDHPMCFNQHGEPSYLALHPYHRLTSNELAKIIEWCKQVGLEFQIDADSEYFPGVTLRFCLYALGWSALNIGIGRV
jgi:hypothetical protein